MTTTSALPSLEIDDLLAEASRRAGGRSDFGEKQFMQGLEWLVASLERDAFLTPIGRMIARERILNSAKNRLDYIGDRKLHPEIAKERIVAPIVVVGMPRTGSTILHDILAQDPDSRAPLTWEVMFPSPPPEPRNV
jgi:hypothetical protein